jgi:protocatechuate 3,4-dioxygenase beta subunit
MRVPAIRFTAAFAFLVLSACGGQPSGTAATTSTPASTVSASPATATSTSACPNQFTPAQTEGPYFKAGSPAGTSLIEGGMTGTRLLLTGRVLSLACAPVAGATLDFWQANASGVYDNSGYRLRGHQSTDAAGRYSLETIVPGEYPGRTEHIHVKVQVPGKAVLTTQLYFPGVASNQQDSIFDAHLLLSVQDTAAGEAATFDFVTSGSG